MTRRWLYQGELMPAAELDGAGTLLARYVDGVTVKGTTSYKVVADNLGTPKLLVNATTGVVAQRLEIDEWGQVTADSNVGFQAFGFAHGIYDPDTGSVDGEGSDAVRGGAGPLRLCGERPCKPPRPYWSKG